MTCTWHLLPIDHIISKSLQGLVYVAWTLTNWWQIKKRSVLCSTAYLLTTMTIHGINHPRQHSHSLSVNYCIRMWYTTQKFTHSLLYSRVRSYKPLQTHTTLTSCLPSHYKYHWMLMSTYTLLTQISFLSEYVAHCIYSQTVSDEASDKTDWSIFWCITCFLQSIRVTCAITLNPVLTACWSQNQNSKVNSKENYMLPVDLHKTTFRMDCRRTLTNYCS
jgi:hypothetical protein